MFCLINLFTGKVKEGELPPPCPKCGNEITVDFKGRVNIKGESHRKYRCMACDHIWTEPPTRKEMDEYH